MKSATVDLFVTAFTETNPVGKRTGATDHRVMMEDIGLWERFLSLKSRACNEA